MTLSLSPSVPGAATWHVHPLEGCAVRPLGFYLKALGVLRIVTRQGADPDARGSWSGGSFRLLTTLRDDELTEFFLCRYAPTPFLSPWNKGSGFYGASDPVLAGLEQSRAERFAPFRRAIAVIRESLERIHQADARVRAVKARTKAPAGSTAAAKATLKSLKTDPEYLKELADADREFKKLKNGLYLPILRNSRGPERDWMDTAMVLDEEGAPEWPSLLGTGGNDGRLDFTYNAMQRITEIFDVRSESGDPLPLCRELLRNALFGEPTEGMRKAKVGHFVPGSSGGANGSNGPASDARVNPWDFLLILEGAVLFRGRATRRMGRVKGRPALPFAVHTQPVGYGSAGRNEEARGELWVPLWKAWASVDDVAGLLGEGRSQARKGTVTTPIAFARAVSSLGVARGVSGFERYGFFKRKGKSYLAVPLGRVTAEERPEARLVDDIAPWLDRVSRLTVDGKCPARFRNVSSRLLQAVYDFLVGPVKSDRETATALQAILVSAAEVEIVQASGTGFSVGPIPRLSPGWLLHTNDGSVEWRLAAALGSATLPPGSAGRTAGRGVRVHALPLTEDSKRFLTVDDRLVRPPDVVMRGRNHLDDLIALVIRRAQQHPVMTDGEVGEESGVRCGSLIPTVGYGAVLPDLAVFINGGADVSRAVLLARAFMAVTKYPYPSAPPRAADVPDEPWQAIRLLGQSYSRDRSRVHIRNEPSVVRRLVAGDVQGALRTTVLRLRASGMAPPISCGAADREVGGLWAAALAFPIEEITTRIIADNLTTRPSE